MTALYPFPADEYTLVGRVKRAHGLKGEIKVTASAGRSEDFRKYSRVALVATDGRMTARLRLDRVRPQGKQIILKLDTIDTKNEADLTVGMGVLVPTADVPESLQKILSPHPLLGLAVRRIDNDSVIGRVDSSFSNGAQEILVVRQAEREYLIPCIDGIIVEADDFEIKINPLPGLLEANEDSETTASE